MKKIIDGKIYNTDTAELLHEWNNGMFASNFGYREESLYKTKKGAYFIAGGSNSTCGGSDIRVLSEAEAITWLEEHEGTDALQEYFGDEIEEA